MDEKIEKLIYTVFNKFATDASEASKVYDKKEQFKNWMENYGESFAKEVCYNLDINQLDDLDKEEKSKIEKFYDSKGNASHYDSNRLNSIVKFERIWGTLAVMTFCEITADRYRERIGKKDNQSLQQEVLKIEWYEKAAVYFKKRIGTTNEIIVDNTKKFGLPWEK